MNLIKRSCLLFCYFLLMLPHLLHADSLQPKIAYLNAAFPSTDSSFYVGQILEVKYTLTLLLGAKLKDVEFMDFGAKNNLEIENKDAQWQILSDGMITNTYYYKIKAQNFTIPPLRVVVSSHDNAYQEEVVANGIKLQAIELLNNPQYANVIADAMEVVDYRASQYDDNNNIIIFQIESKDANLSSMRIGTYSQQGLESSKIIDGITYGIYYVVLDKNIKSLSFDYFNLHQKAFVTITLPIDVPKSVIEDGGDTKPRNTFLIFKNLMVGGLIVFFVLVLIIFKRGRKITLGIIGVLIMVLTYNMLFNFTSGIAQAGTNVSIIPTHNSTIFEVLKVPTEVSIIGEYNDYYKVMIDSKVGWIRKENVSKN